MKKNKKTIDKICIEIEKTIQTTSVAKVTNRIISVAWTEEDVLDALNQEDTSATIVDRYYIKGELIALFLNCRVLLEADEVRGITTPFMCTFKIIVSFIKEFRDYKVMAQFTKTMLCVGFLGTPCFAPSSFVYEMLTEKTPLISINDIVRKDFCGESAINSYPKVYFPFILKGKPIEDLWNDSGVRMILFM